MKSREMYLVDGKYAFKDLVSIERLKSMFEDFSKATGFTTCLISYPDQELLIGAGWQDICTKFHRAFPASEIHCKQSNLEVTSDLKKPKMLNVQHCKNGLVDGATPIIIKGVHVANLCTGQTLFEKPDTERFRKQGEEYGYDVEAYLEALKKVPIVTEEAFKKTLEFLSEIAVMLAEQGLKELQTREAIQAAKGSERKFKALFNNTFEFIGVLAPDGTVIEANQTSLEFGGLEESDVIGKLFWETPWWTHSRDLQGWLREAVSRAATGELVRDEVNNIDPDGRVHYVDFSIKPVMNDKGDVIFLIPEGRDITERSNAEERFRSITENAVDYIFIKDKDRKYTFANKAMQDLLGQPEKEILGKTPQDIFGPEQGRIVEETDNRTFSGETVNVTRSLAIGGKQFFFNTIQTPLTIKDGEVSSIMGIVRNVTELNQADIALRESNARNEALLAAMPEMMFVLTKDGTYVDFKADNEDKLAIPPGEIIGKNLSDSGFPEDTVKYILEQIEETLKTGKTHSFEYQLANHTGNYFFDARIVPFGEDKVLATVRDITGKKKAEEDLQKLQRLKSVGILAGGIAHDFNNILMGLYGNVALAKETLSDEHPAFQSLEEAENSMGRATRLTNQLLTFAKGGEPVRENVRVDELVKGITLFDLSGSNVKPIFDQADDLWMAEVDKGQIQQVFSNLIINTVQAMPDGGDLYITLENVVISENEHPHLKPEKYIRVTLKDEGVGIDQKHLDRIFDPYFSTKQTGSGLGLATTYSIMSKHGGHISVESELGKGTTFTLYLPASESQHPPETTSPEISPPTTKKTTGRILVMDDDPAIRKVVTDILERSGHRVETATSGKQAIELYKQSIKSGEPFDAIIMDLTIPGGIGGKEAIKDILKINSDARVIVSSGYADDPVMARYAEYGFHGVVAKPYTKGKLLAVLNRVMK